MVRSNVLYLYAKALLSAWWALIGSATATIIGVVAMVANRSSAWLLWAYFGCGVLFLITAGFVAWKKEHERVELLTRLSDSDPHVILEFSREPLPFAARQKFPQERPIFLRNVGKKPAFKVQIQEVDLRLGTANFPRVEVLDKENVPLRAELVVPQDGSMRGVSEFEYLLQLVWETQHYGKDGDPEIPLTVSHEDDLRNQYETEMCVTYNLKDGTRALNFKFKKSPPAPFS